MPFFVQHIGSIGQVVGLECEAGHEESVWVSGCRGIEMKKIIARREQNSSFGAIPYKGKSLILTIPLILSILKECSKGTTVPVM